MVICAMAIRIAHISFSLYEKTEMAVVDSFFELAKLNSTRNCREIYITQTFIQILSEFLYEISILIIDADTLY